MKIVYIDNYDSFANTIKSYFQDAGAEVIILKSDCEISAIQKEDPEMILLGPGPNSPKESGNYLDVIEYYHKKIPIFGICLGFQAIMHYFGSKIIQLDNIVHGSASEILHSGKGIFLGIENKTKFARYHSLGVEEAPSEFVITASTMDGENKLIMGAKHKTLQIEGVLFHPESILSLTDDSGKKLIRNVVKVYGKTDK